ncbi:MAG: amidase [Phenylobacterium sp.]|uniref:amidase n=1 Tax=Phenylobacterium sp. TaxID=1871053 RepID=UPI0025F1F427|nr:amidase [Phenylobacterium sp.]MBI1197029.1 amidase [Phenylobacterium sp.]
MSEITRRAFGALTVAGAAAGLAGPAAAKPAAPPPPAWPDATETAAMIRRGDISALEATQAAIGRAEALQGKLNFLVNSDFDRALDRARAGGVIGPFAGVPFLIKDLEDFWGLPTRYGSRAFLNAPPAREQDELVRAFLKTGVNVIGKSATPEAGFLPTTEPLAFGPTRNPWDATRSSGGSSGGAAVAVAAGVVPVAHASDGGGSIRIPSSCCGLFGLKPSRGRIVGSRGATKISDLGVNHVVSRSVRDSAAMLAAIEDRGDGAQLAQVGLVSAPLKRRLRVGLLIDGTSAKPPTPEVKAATESAAKLVASLGHHVEPTSWPVDQAFMDDFLLLWASGAAGLADSISKMAGRPADDTLLEPFSLGLVNLARTAPPDALPKAVARLQANADAYGAWFDKNRFDVVMSPVLNAPPPPLGFVGPEVPYDTLVERLIAYVGYTPYHNIAGAPAMSVPLTLTDAGLPVGTQFAARVGQEGLLLQLAYQLEAARPWAQRAPAIHA